MIQPKAQLGAATHPAHEDPTHSRLAGLEGCQVSVALDDGSRIDDCQLVSGGRHGVETLWLFTNGTDRFVPMDRVVDIWEAPCPAA